ncbi:hypothetical protein [Allohahella marinimesophila]|uniref:Uncharacterized protein n=1 Tax=Allohahella marinimesophila TaxID=1054972 RepID=A0ABP7PW02_9GAMM
MPDAFTPNLIGALVGLTGMILCLISGGVIGLYLTRRDNRAAHKKAREHNA